MTGAPSGERPAQCANGPLDGGHDVSPASADAGRHPAGARRDEDTSERDPAAGDGRLEQTAQGRLRAAEMRAGIAAARDLAAGARDLAAEARDLAMAQLDAVCEQDENMDGLTGTDKVIRAAGRRKRAARRRVRAAEDRAQAAQDREAGAREREQSARERRVALEDYQALASAAVISETDPVTGLPTRPAGLIDMRHELERCRGTDSLLVVAHVVVVGLKRVNDRLGADEMLTGVVSLIGTQLRSYDLMVRLEGDEFLCAMPTMTLNDARRRFSAMAEPHNCAIRTGFAQFAPGDTITALIARADGDLTENRNVVRRRGPMLHG